MVNRLVRLAAFQNPEFYSAQAMRLPTFGIPRIIGCAELPPHHVAPPRGCREAASDSLLRHDTGVLAAATAFGKPVVAAHASAARKTNTLILVHRRQLLDQWIARLTSLLDLPGRSRPGQGGRP